MDAIPPQNTAWNGSFQHGTAMLSFIGKEWSSKTWWAKNHYCISVDHNGTEAIYKLVKHDGTTSGETPVRGNARCVDGDIIWEWISAGTLGSAWLPQTRYSVGDTVYANGNTYKCVFDGRLEMPSHITLENISTNMTAGGDVFAFYEGGTNVPIKTNYSGKWTIKVDNVERYRFRDFANGYFGVSSNPLPTIYGSGGGLSEGYSKTEVDVLLSGKANKATVYTRDEIDSLLSGAEDGKADENTYTKAQVNALLAKKADAEHEHSEYATVAALDKKLDADDSRIHTSHHIGTHDVDEAGMDDGMVMYYDAASKTYKFKKVTAADEPEIDPPVEDKVPMQNVIYTKSVYCDKTFTAQDADTEYQFTIPEGTEKFRVVVIPATSVSIAADTYIEFVNADGTLAKKVSWSEVAADGIIADCTAGKTYAFKCSITTSSATTIALYVDCGEKINQLKTNTSDVPALDSKKEEPPIEETVPLTVLDTKTLTTSGSGLDFSCEDWSAGSDFQFTVPAGVTKLRFSVTLVEAKATLSSADITFVDVNWNAQVKIKAQTPAVLNCIPGKTYAWCIWVGTNMNTDVICKVEVGGEVETSAVTEATVIPAYS